MEKKLTSFEVYFMVKELQYLVESKIDQIYGDDEEVLFSLHKQDFGKKFLKIKGELLYVVNQKNTQNESPSNFCTILRKNIINWRIKSIKQVESERIIDIELYFKDENRHIIIELFGGGNVILLKDNVIISVQLQKTFTSRKLLPKEKYEYPKQEHNFLKVSEKDLTKIFQDSNKENIVKTLAMELFLGGIYAQEILTLAKLDKNTKSKDADVDKIFSALQTLISSKLKPNKVSNYIVPIELTSIVGKDISGENTLPDKKYYSSFSEAIFENEQKSEEYKQKETIHTIFDKKIDKLKSIVELQKKQIEKMKKEADEKNKLGNSIYKNYAFVDEEIKKSKIQKIKLNID